VTEVTDRAARVAARRVPGVEGRAGKFPGPSLIPALNAIQERLGWLPREELEELARDARRPRYEIEGLISFYPHFRTSPPPKVALHVCHDLPCFLRDGEARLAELRERYGEDAEIELVEVSCLGRCDTAPAVAVNERPAPIEQADTLVAGARTGDVGAGAANERTEPWPNDPYPTGSGVAQRYTTLRALLAGELDADTIMQTL
jgi:formate dehydrogenase beta subunit